MEIITKVSTILSLMGTGAFIGIFVKYFLDVKKEKRLKNQEFKEDWYANLLVYMRSYLNPESVSRGFYHFQDKSIKGLTGENLKIRLMENIEENYLKILLYANDKVILSVKDFINNPSEKNLLNAIISMRNDLWGKTKLNIDNIKI